jgi:hypothetical protein
MAYDQGLAQRVREMLDELEPPGLAEKKMFGGVAFMLRGNLACLRSLCPRNKKAQDGGIKHDDTCIGYVRDQSLG